MVGPDNRIEVSLRWDHRVTDAVVAARALKRLHVDNRIARTFTTWPYNGHPDMDLSGPDYLGKVQDTTVCFLLGWRFRNYELFHKHADAVRHYYRPVEKIQASVDRKMAEARSRGACAGVRRSG